MITISSEHIREVVRRTHTPQFMLPARFTTVSFDTFVVDPSNAAQIHTINEIQRILQESRRQLRFWQKRDPAIPRGIYMMGPPGIGKTHLLAAAFLEGPESRLFATFDEFLAAAGVMGMEGLSQFLAQHQLVCIDEIDLDDPANIMLLNSLLRVILAADSYVIVTANASPGNMAGGKFYDNRFARELGEIANSFSIIELGGKDWRESLGSARRDVPSSEERVVSFTWHELTAFLRDVHPMYDARWLLEVDVIEITGFEPLADSDRAIRFVRFIDRVYDRAVKMRATGAVLAPDTILTPIQDQPRFHLHYIRCRSRLTELLGLSSEYHSAAAG